MEFRFRWAKSSGEVEYIPVCTIAIQKRDKKTWLERVFKVDAGSDITFMNKEDCFNLGYNLSDCKISQYTNTNNETYRVYVRKFTMRISDYVIMNVPIGFSSNKLPMDLLGRARIFDLVSVCFDSLTKQTIFVTPETSH
ncbi:MAG: hypothetical protein WA941_05065 [Nitrososphaeraceae archaeon]